jgi:hypothetical protein
LSGLITADIEFPGGLGDIGKAKIIVYKDPAVNIPDFFNRDLPRDSRFAIYRPGVRIPLSPFVIPYTVRI